MKTEIQPHESIRAEAFRMWMASPMPMVTKGPVRRWFAYAGHPTDDREDQENGGTAKGTDSLSQPTAQQEECSQRNEENGKNQHSITARNHRGKPS